MMATYEMKQHPRALDNETLEKFAHQREQAYTELSRICAGERRWTMCVPVQEDDSDMVFADALNNSRRLEQEVYRLRAVMKQIIGRTENLPPEIHDKLHEALWGEYP